MLKKKPTQKHCTNLSDTTDITTINQHMKTPTINSENSNVGVGTPDSTSPEVVLLKTNECAPRSEEIWRHARL